MKKIYKSAKLDIMYFNTEDVLTRSAVYEKGDKTIDDDFEFLD